MSFKLSHRTSIKNRVQSDYKRPSALTSGFHTQTHRMHTYTHTNKTVRQSPVVEERQLWGTRSECQPALQRVLGTSLLQGKPPSLFCITRTVGREQKEGTTADKSSVFPVTVFSSLQIRSLLALRTRFPPLSEQCAVFRLR